MYQLSLKVYLYVLLVFLHDLTNNWIPTLLILQQIAFAVIVMALGNITAVTKA
jgi:hypothetical protein